MNEKQCQAALSNMAEWLSHPGELGKAPSKIELVEAFEHNGMIYYAFKFKSGMLGKWLLGVSGGYEGDGLETCGHTFSNLEPYAPETARQDCIAMIENIVAYRKPQVAGLKSGSMVRFIDNAGGCIITKSLLAGTSTLKWLFRSESVRAEDNGWRAFGDTDTQEYIDDVENHIVVDFNTLANIEPMVLDVYDMPVGTDLEYHCDETGRYFTDSETGERITHSYVGRL